MRPSLRFLAWSTTIWIGLRAASFGLFPDSPALAQGSPAVSPSAPFAQSTPPPPPEVFAAAPLALPAGFDVAPPALTLARAPRRHDAASVMFGASLAETPMAPQLAIPSDPQADLQRADVRLATARPFEQWPIDALLRRRAPDRGLPGLPGSAIPRPRDERLRLTAWAMTRGPAASGSSLANGGMLGGSQAGARLLYRIRPRLDLSLRVSMPMAAASRGGELAAGVRYQPVASLPVALTLERRQAIGRGGGRSDFAMFAEGGVWQRPLGARFMLDGYAQAGVVGVSRPAAFLDGAATATRPLWRGISGGAGAWGGIQPGAARLDVGPRLTWRPLPHTRVAIDYRLQVAGQAQPGSGPVMTLSGDF